MKINQTETQLELKTSGLIQIIASIILIVVGIAVSISVLIGVFKDADGKSLPIYWSLVGLVMLLAGGFASYSSKNRQIILKKDGTSTVSTKRIIGGKTQETTFETSRVVAINLSTHFTMNSTDSNSNSNSSSQRRSELSLVLDDNSLISVASSGGSNGGFSFSMSNLIMKAPLSKEANQIATYLGVPLQSSGMSDPVSDIKSMVDAFHQPVDQPQPFTGQPIQPTSQMQSPENTTDIGQPSSANQAPSVAFQQPTSPVEETQSPQDPTSLS